IERRQTLEADAAERDDLARRAVAVEKTRLIILVERHQGRRPARHARVASQRGMLRLREQQSPSQRRRGRRERGGPESRERQRGVGPFQRNGIYPAEITVP